MTEIYMPKMGMDMKEGVLVRWLKNVGDKVEKDEPIMEIETDKITMESESPVSGYILALYSQAGDVIPVLDTMGYIGAQDEKAPDAPAKKGAVEEPAAQQAAPAAEPAATAAAVAADDIRATPYARALAKERNIDLAVVVPMGKHGEIKAADVLSTKASSPVTPLAQRIAEDKGIDTASLQGSGFGGRVTKADVLASVPAAPQAACADDDGALVIESRRPLSGMNRVIAERMTLSHTEVPNVTQSMMVDVTKLLAMRASINSRRENKISVNDFILKATAIALKEFPEARTKYTDNEFIVYANANIGMAVSTGNGEGLLVPVIPNADRLSLSQLSAKAKDLALRARDNKLKPCECQGGTFTVSNMGMFDVYHFTPIINQPEAGILGVGTTRDELYFAEDGSVKARKICMICLTFDHRVMNGVGAAKFTARIRDLLENPEDILV